MAATCLLRRCPKPGVVNRILMFNRQIHAETIKSKAFPIGAACGCATGAAITLYVVSKSRDLGISKPVLAKVGHAPKLLKIMFVLVRYATKFIALFHKMN